MIEGIIAWICLFVAIATKNTDYLIASSLFAIATQISLSGKK